MPPEQLREAVRARPFVPFRICLTDGQSYDIRHPELLMTGKRSAVIGVILQPTEPEPLSDRFVTVDLLHVVRIEPLEVSAQPGNGQP